MEITTAQFVYVGFATSALVFVIRLLRLRSHKLWVSLGVMLVAWFFASNWLDFELPKLAKDGDFWERYGEWMVAIYVTVGPVVLFANHIYNILTKRLLEAGVKGFIPSLYVKYATEKHVIAKDRQGKTAAKMEAAKRG